MENMFVGILMSGACGCAAPPAERFMLIAESGRVHLHGVVTRDVRLSFLKVRKILYIQPIFTLQITAIRHGELKPRSPGTASRLTVCNTTSF